MKDADHLSEEELVFEERLRQFKPKGPPPSCWQAIAERTGKGPVFTPWRVALAVAATLVLILAVSRLEISPPDEGPSVGPKRAAKAVASTEALPLAKTVAANNRALCLGKLNALSEDPEELLDYLERNARPITKAREDIKALRNVNGV